MSNKQYASLDEVRGKTFLGHPVGLWALFTTEMWERFCYYGMRALLVLYLISTLTDSNPGFGWSERDANELYGWFTGLVYLLPLLGGFLADRFLGQHRSVLLGGILMATGEFCLFYTEYFRQSALTTITPSSCPTAFWCFIIGLALITIGNGFFKPCISVMVGELYEKNDPRRDDAFSIFYMGINVGAFFSPLIAGSIGEKVSWHWGFLTACIGMLFGLTTYTILRPQYLGHIGMRKNKSEISEESITTLALPTVVQSPENKKVRLSKIEIDRIAVILTLTFFCIAFWSVFEQAGTSLNIFAKKGTNRQVPAVIAQKVPGFLANQDELDVKIAMNDLRKKLFALITATDALENDIAELPSELCTLIFSQKFTDAKERIESLGEQLPAEKVDVFKKALDSVSILFESASSTLNKANEARRQAGFPELSISITDFTQAYEQEKVEQEELTRNVDRLFSEKTSTLVKADQETLDVIKEGILQDVTKAKQVDFLAQETQNIDQSTAIYTFPATWYQSVNPLSVVIFAPLFNLFWGFLRKHHLEPSTPVKFGVGLILLSVAFMFMIAGAFQSVETNGNAAAYWLLFTYVFCTWGELCLSPVGLSMVSRLAPPRYASLLMGTWFLSSAIAGYLSGKLAAVLGSGSNSVSFFFGPKGGLADFFLILTIAPMLAGVIVFLISPKLCKMMHENE